MKLSALEKVAIVAALLGTAVIAVNFMLFQDNQRTFPIVNFAGGVIIIAVPLLAKYFYYSRTKKIESTFPQFLRDVTENIEVGMTLPQAIRTTTNNDYGDLTHHVKEISAKISWGIPFEKVLIDFSDKINSVSLRRTIQTIIEAHRSGGKIGPVLETTGESLRELERIKKQRAISVYSQMVTSYMIFFIFLGVMVGMSSFLIPAFRFEQGVVNPQLFDEIFNSLVVIQGLFAGLAIGKMAEGTLFAGVKHSVVLVVIGYTVLYLF